MMRNYLLPNKYKKLGVGALALFGPLALISLILDTENWAFTLPALSLLDVGVFGGKVQFFQIVRTNPVNEIAMLGLLVSLCLIALSKEKDEDEMTGYVRMQSFVWSLWVSALILALGILFFYSITFLYFSFCAVYAFILIYILKFNITMRSLRKEK